MENSSPQPDQPVSLLTLAELETLIINIVRNTIRQEMGEPGQTGKVKYPSPDFLATFGTWEDSRTAEEIIDDIYTSRTLPDRRESL